MSEAFKFFVYPWRFVGGNLLDFKGSSMSVPVLITVSNVLDFSSHESLFPTRRSRLTSSRYFRMAVGLRSLDFKVDLFLGKWILAKAWTSTVSWSDRPKAGSFLGTS